MFSSRSTKAVLRACVVALLSVALVPLASLPASAAQSSEPKVASAEKLAPLASEEAKPTKPQVPVGDFSSPPALEGLVAHSPMNGPARRGDGFVADKSRLVERNEFTNVYDNGDGTASADVYATPANYRDVSGVFKPIDNKVVTGENGKLKNASGPISFELTTTPDKGPLASITRDGKSLSFDISPNKSSQSKNSSISPNISSTNTNQTKTDQTKTNQTTDVSGASQKTNTSSVMSTSAPIVDANSVTYVNAFTSTDIRYDISGFRLKESLVVKDPAGIVGSYASTLKLDGLHGITKADSTIAFQDNSGQDVITVPQG